MEQKDHFVRIFSLLAAVLILALIYVFAITFIAIPKENVRFADTSLGFLQGSIIAGIVGYFCGGSPPSNKKPDSAATGTTTAEISATVTQQTEDPATEKTS